MKTIINNLVLTDSSKEADANTAFVCSKQNEQYLEDAKANGCKEIIYSNELKKYFDFSSIKIVGITGTNGKTTTAAAIYSTLLDLGYKAALQGTRGFFINDERVEKKSLTTPVQLANFDHIQKAIEAGCEYFIMEVSSHAIAQNRIEGLDFELKVLTNITRDHLDYHGTLDEYINVKNSFFSDESKKLINKDELKAKYNIKNGFAYGLDNPATYKVGAYSFKDGTFIMMQHFDKMFSLSSHLMGLFNVYNLTCAFSAVHILTNRDYEEIAEALENFGGVSGRMEVINTDPLVIVDFAHTPDGMKQVFDSFKDKDIIAVFGAGGDRDKKKRPIMGKIASEYAKHVIITSDNPRFEDPDIITEDILSGISKKENVEVDINRRSAIAKALQKATDDSVVLILGKGDEEYQIIYDKEIPLNDKEIVQSLI